jgi:hypothetical protein
MLSDPITLNSEDYTLRSIVDDTSIRGVAGLAAGTQKTIVISHDTQGPSGKLSDRRRVQWAYTKPNSAGELRTLQMYTIAVIPQDGTFSSSDVDDGVTVLTDFFTEATHGPARLAKWLAGEP